MFNQDKDLQQLKKLFNNSHARLIPAKVLSIDKGNTCTIQPVGSTLSISGVPLFQMGTPERRLMAIPRIDSTVLVSPVEEKVRLDNLIIMQVLEVETIGMLAAGCYFESGPNGTGLGTPLGALQVTPELLENLLPTQKGN